ncbi:MAG: bifunctional adenosylcobinamide kinase/adenosylcobinamide-phosphate guanylyltransferase [Spirochaetia bacterium]|nr:bifunctional adenosylcobinamide kinase/adenosylcobinamide-phosphate guanylyltransferase [Spirochaetia bacterium]
MIRLYIGGTGHGQAELAEKETGRKPDIANFHLLTKQLLAEGASPQEYAKKLVAENPDAVICSDEIGCGIHPLLQEERTWREETGRALCIIAEAAGTVTRVFYGIGQRIKG